MKDIRPPQPDDKLYCGLNAS